MTAASGSGGKRCRGQWVEWDRGIVTRGWGTVLGHLLPPSPPHANEYDTVPLCFAAGLHLCSDCSLFGHSSKHLAFGQMFEHPVFGVAWTPSSSLLRKWAGWQRGAVSSHSRGGGSRCPGMPRPLVTMLPFHSTRCPLLPLPPHVMLLSPTPHPPVQQCRSPHYSLLCTIKLFHFWFSPSVEEEKKIVLENITWIVTLKIQ